MPRRDDCCNFLQNNITANNCMQVLLISGLHKIEGLPQWLDLEKKSLNFLAKSADDIVRASPLDGMDLSEVVQV